MSAVDLIRSHRDDLVAKRDRALAALDKLNSEITECDTALRVFERAMTRANGAEIPSANDEDDSHPKKQIRSALVQVLESASPNGLTVHEVVTRVSELLGFEVNQNTTSVTLGRIKKDGGARLDGRLWFHVSGNGSEETADLGLPSRTQTAEGGDWLGTNIATS